MVQPATKRLVTEAAATATYETLTGAASKYARRSAPAVSDLTYPLVMAHRGAANIFPESTLTGYINAAGLTSLQAVECGDYRTVSDGGIVDFHDDTVDRTTTSAGNASSFSTPGMKRLVVDSSSWFGGGWPDAGVSTLPEVMGAIGGLTVLVPEVKDLSDATASAMCKKIKAMGLQDSVILQSFNLTNLQVPDASGIATMFLTGTLTGSFTPDSLAAAGVKFVCFDWTATGDKAAFAASMKAKGMKVIAYTIDHQYNYDAAIAAGCDGVLSNDPIYVGRSYAAYRKAASAWNLNGTWGHGMLVAGTGPFTVAQRGSFVGAPGAWRWKMPNNQLALPGEVCPVPSPAGTYSVTTTFVVEGVPTNTAQGAAIFVAAPDDKITNLAGNVPLSYLVKARASGTVNAWRIDAAGASTAFPGITTTAWSIPTLSAGLTSGVAVTSLPVNALTVAVKAGHQFVLPTGQVATASGAAAVAATAIPVSSITPSAAVVSGASLLPRITIKADITPTSVTFTRTDEAAAGTSSMTDSSTRGGYVVLSNLMDNGGVSFESIAVA